MVVGTCRWVTKDDLSFPRNHRNEIIYITHQQRETYFITILYYFSRMLLVYVLGGSYNVPKNSVKLKLLARSHAQNGRCFLLNLPGQPYNIVIGALPFVMVCTHVHKPLIPLPLLALGINTNIYIYSYAYKYIYTYIL